MRRDTKNTERLEIRLDTELLADIKKVARLFDGDRSKATRFMLRQAKNTTEVSTILRSDKTEDD